MNLFAGNIEAGLVNKFVPSGGVVFDVGASEGNWTELALSQNPKEIHLFEPIPSCFENLQRRFSSLIKEGKVVVSQQALFRSVGSKEFHFYFENPTLSTLYRRVIAEKEYGIEPPQDPIIVQTTTIDEYCQQKNIEKIDYLKIDVEGAELDVLMGSADFLSSGRIGCLEFEYGGTYLDSKTSLEEVYLYLVGMGYMVYKVTRDSLIQIDSFIPKYEDYNFSIFLAKRDFI